MAKNCPTCGGSNRDDAVYCSSCGASIGGQVHAASQSGSTATVKPVPSVRVISPIAGGFPGFGPGPVLPTQVPTPFPAPFPTAVPFPAGIPPGGGGNIQPFSSIFGLGPATVAVTTPARRATLAFLISFIAGLLILANAALLVNPFFATIWVFLFPFVGTIGLSVAFAIGVILGLIVLVGSFLYLVGFGITGSIIVFPAAIISFVIGGGFIAGLVLGIVAGLLGIFGR